MPVRHLTVSLIFLTVPLAIWACVDLSVANLNEPDQDRVLTSFRDSETLISGAYNQWFRDLFRYAGPGMTLSQQSFQHSAPWSCSQAIYSNIPRIGILNDKTCPYYPNTARTWFSMYRSITAARDGLKAMEVPEVAAQAELPEVARAKAFASFVLGISYGTVALFFDRGFIGSPTENKEPLDYGSLMDRALGYLDESIAIAGATPFTIPYSWMQTAVEQEDFIRIVRSHKARFKAQLARSAQERGEVDWISVIQDVDAGIQDDLLMEMDWNNGWHNEMLDYATWPSWHQLPYFVYGMADQSGDYQEWVALPISQMRHVFSDGRPVLIVTPDLRFPQGGTIQEQRDHGGLYFRMTTAREEGDTWKKPEKGTWRWSWYKTGPRGHDYPQGNAMVQPLITLAEMRLLKAEGLYRLGDRAGASQLINESRTRAGLSPTDAAGSNASCVPRLPDASCGDLWEILKWEKRMEVVWTGLSIGNWWLDGRGWGDLWVDTPLQFPIPCEDLKVLGMTPCYSFGGRGGEGSSPGSSYRFPGEVALMASLVPGRLGVEAATGAPGCDAPALPRKLP